MKSMKVKSLLLALGLSLVVGKSFAISFKVDGINYVANADTAIVKGYSEIPENGELKLASTVTYGGKDYRVTTVQSSAFLSCTDIKKLIVPASIKYIQSGAFESCVNMSNLVLEQGNDQLDAASDAFKNCAIEETMIGRYLKKSIFESSKSLQKVILCDNIKRIIPYAFGSCSKLEEINLDNVEEIGYGAFSSCSSIKKVILGKVKVIRNNVFSSCSNLQEINLGDVEEIGESAFSNCTNLKKVSLGSLKSLGRRAFAGSGIRELELPLCLTDFEPAAFENSSLEKIIIKSSIYTIPTQAFSGCRNLVNVDIPNTVTEISISAFENCALSTFDLKNVTKIGSSAFEGCQNLETVNWGNVSCIEESAFKNCGFTKLAFPVSLQTVLSGAFADCQKLESVDISRPVVSSIACFSGCSSLHEVLFPANLTTIGYRAFKGCSTLESINIPDAVQVLGNEAFANTIKIKEFDLSKTKVQKVSSSCFANCTSLEKVLLNEQTDTICECAFENCVNLTNLSNTHNINMVYSSAFNHTKLFENVAEGPAMIGTVMYAYAGTISDKEYVVPENITCIADMVFASQPFQSIKLNSNLKYIGYGAFDNCANLLSLTVPSSVKVMEASSGCTKLEVMTLREGEDNLALGEWSGNKIKKFYMGRNVSSSIDWMPVLENLTIGKYVKSIGNDFSSSKSLTNLELEDAEGTLDFGNNPLVGRITSLYLGRNISVYNRLIPIECKYEANSFVNLAELTIGENVSNICDYFCYKNEKIKELYIPGNVKTIGEGAFCGLSYLAKLIFSEGLEYIKERGFGFGDFSGIGYTHRVKLDSLKFPNSLKEIGDYAFTCTSCLNFRLPDKIKVGTMGFYCLNVDSLFVPNSDIGSMCFASGKYRYIDAHLMPKTYLSGDFVNCPYVETIILPCQLERMDYMTFDYCDKLSAIVCLSNKIEKIEGDKKYKGKIFVLPGSQLPKDDVSYMYTVNKLEYVPDADGNVLFDGVNNMPYEITPVFYQDDKEVELKEAGIYDLSMKIAGTSFDGVYPTGLKVTVASTSGINRVISDTDSQHCPIYNMNGQRVDDGYKGIVIQNGKKRIAK